MTEVMEYKPPLVAGSRVAAIIPSDIEQVWRLATMIHKADMAPKDFKTAEKIAVAILHGAEIGLPPMMALQRIAVINGRPSVWGEAVPGIALATGLVEDWAERVDGEGDLMVATCRVKRKGVKTYAEKQFSIADAKQAGLWGKAGPWTQYPKRMLQMRARVAFRDLFADALGGLYIAEELIGVDEPKDITPGKPAPEIMPPAPPKPQGKKPLPPLVGQAMADIAKEAALEAQAKIIEQDPEAILAFIEGRLSKAENMIDLAEFWIAECEPKKELLLEPDRKLADDIELKHRKRLLNRDA